MIFSSNRLAGREVIFYNVRSPFSGHKIFHHLDRLQEFWCETKRFQIAPITVEIHPTNKCNLYCRDCTFQNIDRTLEIDGPTLERIANQIINLHSVQGIVWSGGGEPTLHKGLVTAINLFGLAGIEQGIASNGTGMTDDFVDAAIRHLTYIRISLNASSRDGYLEMHGADKFRRLKSNIAKLQYKKARAPDCRLTIGSSFLVYPENIDEIPLAIENAAEMGCDYLQIKPAVLNRPRASEKYLQDAYSILSNLVVLPANTAILVEMDKFSDLQAYDSGRNYSTCWGALFYATVAADRRVYVCCHKIGDRNCSIGDLGSESFQEIWSSERKKKVILDVDVSQCPQNCKFHKMNKVLQEIYNSKFVLHENFL